MANLGTIGRKGFTARLVDLKSGPGLKSIRLNGQLYLTNLRRNNVEGDPSSPSMEFFGPMRKSFLWAVDAGSRTFSIKVKYTPDIALQRPYVIIKSNTDIGVASDVVEMAASGSGWVTIGPMAITPTFNGVVEVVLCFDIITMYKQICYWDSIEVT